MVSVAQPAAPGLSNRVSPGRLPRLCIALEAPTAAELLARAERAARESTLLELRLDRLKNPAAAMAPLREFVFSMPQILVIATCRKQTYGGGFKGSAEAEWRILKDAARVGCALVDLELQSAERLPRAALSELRQHANLILSYHDFSTTPALKPVMARMRAIPADIYKLATTARSWKHNVDMLACVRAGSGDEAMVGFCMGELGLASRVLSLREGGIFTYAALGAEAGTAPGQPDLALLRQQYRVEQLNRATRLFGVLGYPLAHSLSPLMHNAAFRRSGTNALYLPLPSRRAEDVLEFAEALGLSGLSVTHPHKETLLQSKILEPPNAMVKAIGAINTVVRRQGKLYGYNTDVAGVLEPLRSAMSLRGAKVLVLGAGGAARAAVFGLRGEGAQVFIYNRTTRRAQKLAAAAKARVVARADLKKLQFQAIVHATPVGQYPKVKESLLTAAELRAPLVFDLVYNPLKTELARLAESVGAHVIPGVEMFVVQGARQFELWTGNPAPVEEMRREVLAALGQA